MNTKTTSTLLALTLALLSACGKKEEPAVSAGGEASAAKAPVPAPKAPVQETVAAKPQPVEPKTVIEIKPAVEAKPVVAEVKAPVEVPAVAAPKLAESPVADVKAQVQAQVQTQIQGLIDRVKTQVADKKYAEALTSLAETSNLKLTADQQKCVADTKAQIQSAVAGQAASELTKSIGGLLEKKK